MPWPMHTEINTQIHCTFGSVLRLGYYTVVDYDVNLVAHSLSIDNFEPYHKTARSMLLLAPNLEICPYYKWSKK
jgi:hypothetical protein